MNKASKKELDWIKMNGGVGVHFNSNESFQEAQESGFSLLRGVLKDDGDLVDYGVVWEGGTDSCVCIGCADQLQGLTMTGEDEFIIFSYPKDLRRFLEDQS